MNRPKLLILGYARHGKDTVAEILRDTYGFEFVSSSMAAAEIVCRPYLAEHGITYASAEECYADRVNHRAAWYDAICEYNRVDPARLAKDILSTGNIYVGMRSAREFAAARTLFDAVWWVDATGRGLPPESITSMDIRYDDLVNVHVIDNSGTLGDLRGQIVDALHLTLINMRKAA